MSMEIKELSQSDIFNVMEFAQSLYGMMNGVFTPDTLNSNLKRFFNTPIKFDENDVLKALDKSQDSENVLIGYNEFSETTSMLFKRAMQYYARMLAFDLQVSCVNAYSIEDYQSKEYKEDLRKVYQFLDKLKYKQEFKRVMMQMVRQETVFLSLREDCRNGYTLQLLPREYCKITGKDEQTILFDFNFQLFTLPSVSLEQYPPSFASHYKKVFAGNGIDDYIPTNPYTKRDGVFATWSQLSPLEDNAWCFKLDDTVFSNVPFLSALMQDTINIPIIKAMQKNKNIISAMQLIMGEIPFMDNQVSGGKTDALKVSPTTLATFLNLLKSGLNESIKFGGVPMEELEAFAFEDKNPKAYSDWLLTTSGQAMGASRVLFSPDKVTQAELENSILGDYNIMKIVYGQFNNFLNYFVNRITSKYKFNFEFDGSEFIFERQKRIENVMKLAENGIVLKSAISSAFGYTPQSFDRMLMASRAENFVLESIHTKSDNKGGREKQDQIAESTERNER